MPGDGGHLEAMRLLPFCCCRMPVSVHPFACRTCSSGSAASSHYPAERLGSSMVTVAFVAAALSFGAGASGTRIQMT